VRQPFGRRATSRSVIAYSFVCLSLQQIVLRAESSYHDLRDHFLKQPVDLVGVRICSDLLQRQVSEELEAPS
jgi:hypothetical protein